MIMYRSALQNWHCLFAFLPSPTPRRVGTTFRLRSRCLQGNPRKAENFDKMFTKVPLRLTPVDDAILQMNARGDEFDGFTFVNPFFSDTEPDSVNVQL